MGMCTNIIGVTIRAGAECAQAVLPSPAAAMHVGDEESLHERVRNSVFAVGCAIVVALYIVAAALGAKNIDAETSLHARSRRVWRDSQGHIHKTPKFEDAKEFVFTPPRSGGPHYAYALIHYEGTRRDDEYRLATRVVIESLKRSGTDADIVVLVSENVRMSTIHQFIEDGAVVARVPNIENPFKGDEQRRKTFRKHFEFTLNKLYVWNMLRYERVVYMDADNVVLHKLDELFLCGHFCAEFMNQVNFHTGLMVIKPDKAKFEALLEALRAGKSYDGADQGFLCDQFRGVDAAPLFDPEHGQWEEPVMRMPFGYNLNHIYFYEKMSFYLQAENSPFGNLSGHYHHPIPALTLAYPITQVAKPWYWWGYLFFNVHWEWYYFRELVREDTNWTLVLWSRFLVMLIMYFAGEWALGKLERARAGTALGAAKLKARTVLSWLIVQCGAAGPNLVGGLVGLYCVVVVGGFWAGGPPLIPLITPPTSAAVMFFLFRNLHVYWCLAVFAMLTGHPRPNVSCVALSLALGVVSTFLLTRVSIYGDFVTKIFFLAFFLALNTLYDVNKFRSLAYSVAFQHGLRVPHLGVVRQPLPSGHGHALKSALNLW